MTHPHRPSTSLRILGRRLSAHCQQWLRPDRRPSRTESKVPSNFCATPPDIYDAWEDLSSPATPWWESPPTTPALSPPCASTGSLLSSTSTKPVSPRHRNHRFRRNKVSGPCCHETVQTFTAAFLEDTGPASPSQELIPELNLLSYITRLDYNSAAPEGRASPVPRLARVGLPDPEVLAVAAVSDRILVSYDRKTMPRHFAHITQRNFSLGLIIVAQDVNIGTPIEEILLVWSATDA